MASLHPTVTMGTRPKAPLAVHETASPWGSLGAIAAIGAAVVVLVPPFATLVVWALSSLLLWAGVMP